MVSVFIYGQMGKSMKVIGKIIVWMEKEYLFGKMVENIKVNISMIKNKAKVYINLLMEEFMRDNGFKENRTEMEK